MTDQVAWTTRQLRGKKKVSLTTRPAEDVLKHGQGWGLAHDKLKYAKCPAYTKLLRCPDICESCIQEDMKQGLQCLDAAYVVVLSSIGRILPRNLEKETSVAALWISLWKLLSGTAVRAVEAQVPFCWLGWIWQRQRTYCPSTQYRQCLRFDLFATRPLLFQRQHNGVEWLVLTVGLCSRELCLSVPVLLWHRTVIGVRCREVSSSRCLLLWSFDRGQISFTRQVKLRGPPHPPIYSQACLLNLTLQAMLHSVEAVWLPEPWFVQPRWR